MIKIRILSCAVYKLLLRIIYCIRKSFELNLVAFMSSRGSECPTRPTLSLVFNLSYNSFFSPVDCFIKTNIYWFFNYLNILGIHFTQICGYELLLSQVGKLIHANLPSLLRIWIMFFHVNDILSKYFTSVDELLFRRNRLVVFFKESNILRRADSCRL